jgi:proline-specific peptidase
MRPVTSALPSGSSGRIAVPGGEVWYRVAGGGPGTPLLLLHGGPGATSHSLEPLAALGDERPVILYDQLGCGRSGRPEDPALWTVERFVAEVAAVRAALGLSRVFLLGHSWGGTLATEVVLSGAPGVAGLVLASPLLDARRWLDDANLLRAELPPEVQETLRAHEAAGSTGSPEYEQATEVFYRRFLCRTEPWPPEMMESLAAFGKRCYEHMWGPSEFHPTGLLRDYDVTPRLGRIGVPVLFTVGRYDEARPETVAAFQALVPGAELRVLERSAHMTMLDEREASVDAVRAFLRRVESGSPGRRQDA